MKASPALPFALLCALLLSGCDFSTALVETPKNAADVSLVGLWASLKPDAEVDQLLILPLDSRELLISFPHGRGKENMLARCAAFSVDKLKLIQIKWLGTANGLPPDTKDVYQYATYDISGSTLTVRLVNPDRIGKDHPTAASLEAAILAAENEPALFREPFVFYRVPDHP